MQQPSPLKVIGFMAIVCGVCSALVSVLAVSLQPLQEANKKLDMQKNVLMAAGVIDDSAGNDVVAAEWEKAQAAVLDLETGVYAAGDVPGYRSYEPAELDLQSDAKDPKKTIAFEGDEARLAQVKEAPRLIPVYLVQTGKRKVLVLPIWGKGLWSTLWGFIALDVSDLSTVAGLTYYQHGETPGLGGEVDNKDWKKKWVGQKVYAPGELGKGSPAVRLHVVKGSADAGSPHEVDGLSGATITSNGVSHMLRLWLGGQAYGPYLAQLRSGGLKLPTAAKQPKKKDAGKKDAGKKKDAGAKEAK